MSEYTDAKEPKGGKKHQFSVVKAEGLQGLQDLLNSTEGKVDSFQRVGESATFIVVMSGVPVKEEAPPPAEAAAAEPEENGKKAAPQKKSA